MSGPGKYIRFVEGPPKEKTKTWEVSSRDSRDCLGWIGWFGRWRKYAFSPKGWAVYEEVCLRDIADFCEARTREHKEEKAKAKALQTDTGIPK